MKSNNSKSIPAIVVSIALALTLILSLTACGSKDTTGTDTQTTSANTSDTNTDADSINFDEKSLVVAYCTDTWDGTFFSNEEHCASIQDGQLWIDCKSTDFIPDMGPYEDHSWHYEVIDHSANGTWIFDSELCVIELWSKGTRLEKIVVPSDTYYTDVYKVGEVLVARHGEKLWVCEQDGYDLHNLDNIIDVYQDSDGKLYYSTFENKNFEITASGEIVELTTTYVRFPRKQGTVVEAKNKQILTQIFNLYCATEWDGSCKIINEKDFVAVDYYGRIYHNNQWVGDISLGTEKRFSTYGWNMDISDEVSYYLDGTHLVRYERGKTTSVDIPDGEGEIRWTTKTEKVVVWLYDGTLLIVEGEKVNVISTSARDMNVAYDTLYYMEGDTVYSLDWYNVASPEVYFEGAYAVSPHEDEAEGAIVPYELANDRYYGYSNIYSPYGVS